MEPVLWDYGADLDVHSKGQYQVAKDAPVTAHVPLYPDCLALAWLRGLDEKGQARPPA